MGPIVDIAALIAAITDAIATHLQTASSEQRRLFQEACRMLDGGALTERLGAISIFECLATQNPRLFHIATMEFFCSYVRHVSQIPPTELTPNAPLREDVQHIMRAIGTRTEKQRNVEKSVPTNRQFSLNLKGAMLRRLRLEGAVLPTDPYGSSELARCPLLELDGADMSDADLRDVKISGLSVRMERINLRSATLRDVKLTEAFMNGAILSGATLLRTHARGTKLDNAEMQDAELTDVVLNGSPLNWAKLQGLRARSGVDFRDAKLRDANLSTADMRGVDVSNAYMFGCILSGTVFTRGGDRKARGLTQVQLDDAWPLSSPAPVLNELVDPQSNTPLIWKHTEWS